MKKSTITLLSVLSIIALLSCLLVGCNSTPDTISAETIVLSQNSITLTEGETATITYTVLPNNAEYYISWRSMDTSIATVSDGIITAVKEGTTNIIASDASGASAVCSVTVEPQTAYQKLSDIEKDFVDTFAKAINHFKNPSSVTVKAINYTVNESSWGILGKWEIYVSAQNGFGGYTSTLYMLSENGTLTKSPLQYEIVGSSYIANGVLYKYDLTLINEALKDFII